jgi:hypothetical protein
MKRLILERRWYEGERIIGELSCAGVWVAFTMEPGLDDDDAPPIEPGFYFMERHDDPGYKYRDTWALVGRDVSHQPEPGIDRSAILIHAGNWDEQTLGCILLGTTIGHLRDETAMVRSGDALNGLRGILGRENAYLTIKDG